VALFYIIRALSPAVTNSQYSSTSSQLLFSTFESFEPEREREREFIIMSRIPEVAAVSTPQDEITEKEPEAQELEYSVTGKMLNEDARRGAEAEHSMTL